MPRPVIESVHGSSRQHPASNFVEEGGGLVWAAVTGRVDSGSCPYWGAKPPVWPRAGQRSLTGQRDRRPAFVVTRPGHPYAVGRCGEGDAANVTLSPTCPYGRRMRVECGGVGCEPSGERKPSAGESRHLPTEEVRRPTERCSRR